MTNLPALTHASSLLAELKKTLELEEAKLPKPQHFPPTGVLQVGNRVRKLVDADPNDIRVIARRLMTHENNIYAIMSGRTRSPGLEILWRMANYFGCTIDQLVGRC